MKKKLPCDNIAFSIASWCRYMKGVDEKGLEIKIDDPAKDKL